ncbi:hypothetical protein CHUAL_010318 [Chamberlinius hualienensis]
MGMGAEEEDFGLGGCLGWFAVYIYDRKRCNSVIRKSNDRDTARESDENFPPSTLFLASLIDTFKKKIPGEEKHNICGKQQPYPSFVFQIEHVLHLSQRSTTMMMMKMTSRNLVNTKVSMTTGFKFTSKKLQ